MVKIGQIFERQLNFSQHLEISKVTIYLIRHAQSAFNAVHDDPNKPDPMIFDAVNAGLKLHHWPERKYIR